ncbi:MAG: insulinase family protein [Desulfobacteraceae bacterium]|nr:insulinase family protein [Desulfobacteraceae bacterium]
MTVKKTLLPNGIVVITRKMPDVRSVSMGVWVNVGARDESFEQSGLSHFIEHMIFKGTFRRTAYQIAKEFDAIGGHTNAFTAMEHTCYHAKVMDSHVETMVEILSDIFLNSIFDPDEVERERPVIFQEIDMVEDTPEEYVHLLSGGNFWGNHPLGRSILGTRENISDFGAAAIKDFFNNFYHPEHIIISAAGNIEHDRLLDLAGPAFEAIKPSDTKLPERICPKIYSGVKQHIRPLEQVHICLSAMGLSITDSRRFAFSLLSTIIGGNMSSRLFQQIREQRGLAYAVYSFTTSHVDSGMFGVYTAVNEKNVLQATQLILQALEQLCSSAVSEEALQDAKEYTKGNLFLASESVDNQMVRLAQNEIHFNRFIPLQSIVEQVEAVTVDDIVSLARTLFQPDRMCLTFLGPMAEKQIDNNLIEHHISRRKA